MRKDVAAMFSAMWRALEQRHPMLHSSDPSLSAWPQWAVERELQQMISGASKTGRRQSNCALQFRVHTADGWDVSGHRHTVFTTGRFPKRGP